MLRKRLHRESAIEVPTLEKEIPQRVDSTAAKEEGKLSASQKACIKLFS